ncbi:hypothetical protein ABTD02_18885, partial [Acinetobacter baumannii]
LKVIFDSQENQVLPLASRYVENHPNSPFVPSLLLGLGLQFERKGYYHRAKVAFEKDFDETQELVNSEGEMVAGRSIA